MKVVTFTKPAVKKFLEENVLFLPVDGDKQRSLVSKYKVSGYPTLVFVDGQGKEAGRVRGYRPPDAFVSAAREIVRKNGSP